MNYIVIELQTSGGVTSNIATTFDDRNAAESKFHQILSSAATSNVETHAAVMLSEDGSPVRYEFYSHEVINDAD